MTVRLVNRARCVLAALCFGTLAPFALAGVAHAQEGHDNPNPPDAITRFTGATWSLIHPDRDYEGGCVVGFLAFRFSPTGYFVYNNRIRGSWRVDELGNLLLRTRDGLKFTLIVDGNTLRPVANLPFARRFYEYQRCPA